MNQIDVRQLLEDPDKGKETIRKGLQLDLQCAVHTMNMVLTTPAMFDVYVEEYWRRMVAFYEKDRNQGKLEFNGKVHA